MAIETAADRVAFLSDWDTLTIGATAVSGIFGNGYIEGLDIQGSKPEFLCLVADLPAITYGTTTGTVSGATYTIMASEPDGTGFTTLVLQEA